MLPNQGRRCCIKALMDLGASLFHAASQRPSQGSPVLVTSDILSSANSYMHMVRTYFLYHIVLFPTLHMKGRSSRVLREEFPELLKLPSLWTQSFFVSTAGNVSHEIIQRYIERQSRV